MESISTRSPSQYKKIRSRNASLGYIESTEILKLPSAYAESASETTSTGSYSKTFFPADNCQAFNRIDLGDAVRRGTSPKRLKSLSRKHLSKKLKLSQMVSIDALKDEEESNSRTEARRVYRDNHYLTN